MRLVIVKLCYLWIEKYKNLENFGLNLCSHLQYIYNPEENSISTKVKPPLPKGLFNEKFSEISAIVGKNASGKSNSLELICHLLKGNLKSANINYIIIYEEGDARSIYSSRKINQSLCIESDVTHEIKKDLSSLPTTNVIYFSNVYDGRKLNINERGMKIISANNNYSHRLNGFSKKQESSIFRKQISFIKNIGRRNLQEISLDIPSNILINLNFRDHKVSLDDKKNHNISTHRLSNIERQLNNTLVDKEMSHEDIHKTLNFKLLECYEHYIKFNDNPIESYIGGVSCAFCSKLLEHFIYMDSKQLNLYGDMPSSLESISHFIEDNDISTAVYNLIDLLESEGLLNSSVLNEYTDIMDCINSVSSDLQESDVENISYIDLELEAKFKIKFKSSTNLSSNIYELIEMLIVNRIINVEWEGISSGHNAFLKLFSLISDGLKNTRASTIICIDEGDLYLHPRWQIEFFRNIERIFPLFSTSENQKIQLILTSHSPFLLTDLPRNNVVIINDGKVIIDDESHNLRTFGANLYDLYGKAFFLDNEKIGTFAFNKIMSTFDTLDEPDNELDDDNIRKLINIIGDDMVRSQLEEMLPND